MLAATLLGYVHVEIFGSMTSEATGEACLWKHVGIFLASDWCWISFSCSGMKKLVDWF